MEDALQERGQRVTLTLTLTFPPAPPVLFCIVCRGGKGGDVEAQVAVVTTTLRHIAEWREKELIARGEIRELPGQEL